MSTPAPQPSSQLRRLPAVERLLQEPAIVAAAAVYSRPLLVAAVRAVLEDARREVAAGVAVPEHEVIVQRVVARAEESAAGTLRPVINATGVIIHTNLGRAPLSQEAIAAMHAVTAGYSNLEYDLTAGERGSRYEHMAELICGLTGAEAALAVNNNAAAVLLALTVLANERDVIIARGQLVEIGGGFRVPDVLRQGGARLVEVGTTNRAYVADYEAAISPQTALLLRVHPSNFRVIGFTREVTLPELVELGGRHGLPVVDDLGSGALLDSSAYGLAHEPMPQESITAGAGLVCFSGDKLLGGPQAGVIAGQKVLVDRLKRHPLARAVRLDKASIAGLQATLLHYARGEAADNVPVWRMISVPLDELDRRARAMAARLANSGVPARVFESSAAVGGGSLPGETLPSKAVAIGNAALPPARLAETLRLGRPAVVGRVEHDTLLLDLRTVLASQDETLANAVIAALD